MQITPEITLKTVLDKYESIWDTPLELCESMCHIEDFDGLIGDLQKFVDAKDK